MVAPVMFMIYLLSNLLGECRYVEGHKWELIDDDLHKYIKRSKCRNCGKIKKRVRF